MIKRQTKSTNIILRVTDREKEAIKEKAAQAGDSVTDYLIKRSENQIIISPLLGREVLQVLHSIHLQLQQLQQKQVAIEELQDLISDYTHFFIKHMRNLTLSTGRY